MDNITSLNSERTQMEEPLGQKVVSAMIQFFYMLAFVLILCPFNFWKKAVNNLAHARENSSWDFAAKSQWPFLSFIKALILNFVIDGVIFISWFVGVIYALVQLSDGFGEFFLVLVATYYAPMVLSPFRDLIVISMLPFKKFLSWCSKPAQQLDIDMRHK